MVIIRPARLGDEGYIIQTWVDNFRDSALAHSLSGSLYNIRWKEIAFDLISRCVVVVAYDEDYPDVIIGFAAFEYDGVTSAVLHYVYVRYTQRGAGVARDMLSLISDRHIVYTHRTTAAQKYTTEHSKLGWTYDFTRIWSRQ